MLELWIFAGAVAWLGLMTLVVALCAAAARADRADGADGADGAGRAYPERRRQARVVRHPHAARRLTRV